ncbi:hypothetical protein M2150_002560 [Lachnospiraceae bacterium PM6-15]|uniref:VTC domain-containing protein n=1 Tax=Ohessyouella blattaphilus TaxID=2949333 RepID=UPI003E18B926
MSDHSFTRKEIKYVLTPKKFHQLWWSMKEYFVPDTYSQYPVHTVYYDTLDHQLIRRSLEKPKYKEKLRLRSYQPFADKGESFIEIKKKYQGVVYKRRRLLDYHTLVGAFASKALIPEEIRDENTYISRQIGEEIRDLTARYELYPQVYLYYDRLAYVGQEDSEIRLTFDHNLSYGETILCDKEALQPFFEKPLIIMELKVPEAIPVPLAEIFSRHEIYPGSFSKYGYYYQNCYQKEKQVKGVRHA